VNLVGACGPWGVTISLRHWAARFETFTERNCWTYDVCAWELYRPRMVLHPSCSGVVWGEWSAAGTGEDLVLAVETSSKLFFRVAL